MSVKEKLMADMKASMKSREKDKTGVLRMLLSELKYAQAAVSMSEELSDEAAMKVIGSYRKRLDKSLADYPEGDARSAIEKEIAIVEAYLPKQASDEEVAAVVKRVLSETEERQFGVLMKKIMAEFAGAADGGTISRILKSELS